MHTQTAAALLRLLKRLRCAICPVPFAPCSHKDRVRLVMLYMLRFEGEASRHAALLDWLGAAGLREAAPGLMAAAEGLLRWTGQQQ